MDATPVEWSLSPVALLRYAGFPFGLLDPLAEPELAAGFDLLLDQTRLLAEHADALKAAIRAHEHGGEGATASYVGMLRSLTDPVLAKVLTVLPEPQRALALRYQAAAVRLDAAWQARVREHDEALERARRQVISLFAAPELREVLLLSNDARYAEFEAWLDRAEESSPGHRRRMTDLLAMYLQRVATKNESHSHFGPISVARFEPGPGGADWRPGPVERRSFWSHWAGEELAADFSRRPAIRDRVCPRRRPLALDQRGELRLFASTTATGTADGWTFVEQDRCVLSEDQLWLWERCDGATSIADLRRAWTLRGGSPSTRCFEAVVSGLAESGWIVDRWEIPVGAPDPLRVLDSLLTGAGQENSPEAATVRRMKEGLAAFSLAPHASRARQLAEIKEDFQAATGTAPNRSRGRHYADRSVLYEEALGPVRGLTLGSQIAQAVTTELSAVFDLVLLSPRLRIRRETEILGRWMSRRFGAGTEIPLQDFYEGFFADKPVLADACRLVDEEVGALDREVTASLLGSADRAVHEVLVDRADLDELIARYPNTPAALCNPDVMIAAGSAADLEDGRFRLVVGDCHAVRDVLTHSSFAPLIQEIAPDLVSGIHARYRSLLDPDEILLDLSRSHLDKTGAALQHPCPDLEVFGLSPKPRDQVIHPSALFLVVRAGRPELRVRPDGRRVRLMAPLAGGTGIRQDPLSPFAFPRHYGGVGIGALDHGHLPRIRCGRVVLHRERWRIASAALSGWSPGAHSARGGAAEYAAARRLCRDLDLPRHGFAKIPGEPKPVYVDWESPLLVRQLFRLARGTAGTVEFSEMLPGPDELWLDIDGAPRTSELRCAVFSGGPTAP
ncbi:lantibiotic dehydratase [Streptomyces sp. NPDC049040]|uniref:lantibiotic dehydratase n=1 Tax=Streptomyces sp. NPDC049040 TaxID=3365593 RepID=UPI0037174E77